MITKPSLAGPLAQARSLKAAACHARHAAPWPGLLSSGFHGAPRGTSGVFPSTKLPLRM
jgi:hypothetical protein